MQYEDWSREGSLIVCVGVGYAISDYNNSADNSGRSFKLTSAMNKTFGQCYHEK